MVLHQMETLQDLESPFQFQMLTRAITSYEQITYQTDYSVMTVIDG